MTTAELDVLTAPGVTRESVDALGALVRDPEWMLGSRTAAWERYDALPMPSTRDEHWRFTSLRRLKLDAVPALTQAPDALDAIQARGEMHTTGASAGLVQVVNGTVRVTGGEALPEGVVFTDLATAAAEHSELLQAHLDSAVPVTDSVDDKFVALQRATLNTGVFLFVPRNTKVELPLRAEVLNAVDGGSVSWRAVIVLEEGAEATFVEEFGSASPDMGGFSNAVVELVAGQASRLTYVTVQDYALSTSHFATHRVLAHREAQVEWTAVGLGASMGKSRMEARLLGPGANVRLNGAYVLDGRQELDYDTQQFHEAPNAYSDLSFKGVLSDRAKSVWRGMIVVHPGAQGTDSYQENRNLLLSKGAHADSIPGLQIEANEVRCTHGATLSKVDAEQLFYLQSRGLSREEATRTIVRGFFIPLLDRVHPESVRDQVRDALWGRLDTAGATATLGR